MARKCRKVLEKHIEAYLVKRCKEIGVKCEKFTSPGRRSVPDRVITFFPGTTIFVELKAPGKKPTELQLKDHQERRELGFNVEVISDKKQVDVLIDLVIKPNLI